MLFSITLFIHQLKGDFVYFPIGAAKDAVVKAYYDTIMPYIHVQ